jgi:hypothetical protein
LDGSNRGIIWMNDNGYKIWQSDAGPVFITKDNKSVYENWGTSGTGYTYGVTPNQLVPNIWIKEGDMNNDDYYLTGSFTSYDSSSGNTGGATDEMHDYVYTVSGCRNADVNGDYYLTDQIYNNKPVYSNGKVYLFTHYKSDVGSDYVCFGTTLEFGGLFYKIGSTIPIGDEFWTSTSDYMEYPITIDKYVKLSGDIKYEATGANINEVNGYYHDNGDNTYTNAAGYTIKWLADYGEWGITGPINGAIIYKGSSSGFADENSVYLGQWYSDAGFGQAPVIARYGGAN